MYGALQTTLRALLTDVRNSIFEAGPDDVGGRRATRAPPLAHPLPTTHVAAPRQRRVIKMRGCTARTTHKTPRLTTHVTGPV